MDIVVNFDIVLFTKVPLEEHYRCCQALAQLDYKYF